MVVVSNFPFVLSEQYSLTVFLPYLNQLTDEVLWEQFDDTFWDNQQGQNNFEGTVIKWCLLNKCNPDWLSVRNKSPQILPNLSGEGVISQAGIIAIDVTIISGADLADRWWGSTLVGRFGVVFASESPLPNPNLIMPPIYINSPSSHIVFPPTLGSTITQYVYYNIPPGMLATIKVYQAPNQKGALPRQSIPPPVYFLAPPGFTIGSPFGTSGQGPPTNAESVYGP